MRQSAIWPEHTITVEKRETTIGQYSCYKMVSDIGQDPLWHYRLGYACYFDNRFNEAAAAFARTLELDPDDDDAQYFLNMSKEEILREEGMEQQEYNPELYSEEEMEVIENHITQNFGDFDSVFHEIISPDIHVDICMIPPSEEKIIMFS